MYKIRKHTILFIIINTLSFDIDLANHEGTLPNKCLINVGHNLLGHVGFANHEYFIFNKNKFI